MSSFQRTWFALEVFVSFASISASAGMKTGTVTSYGEEPTAEIHGLGRDAEKSLHIPTGIVGSLKDSTEDLTLIYH